MRYPPTLTALLLAGCFTSIACADRDGDDAAIRADSATGADSAAAAGRGAGPRADAAAGDFSTFRGVRFGSTVAEALGSARERLEVPDSLQECDYIRPKRSPLEYTYMVEKGRIVRADIRDPLIRTPEGAGIGDTEARLQQLYRGRIRVVPHKYTSGHYLIVRSAAPADTSLEIVFETEGDTVTQYRAGLKPAVEYVEGCS